MASRVRRLASRFTQTLGLEKGDRVAVPKGAVLTHRNMWFQTQAYFCDIDKLEPGDSSIHPAPLSHGSGCYGLPHFAAGAVNVVPESGHFEPAEIFELLDHWPNASFFA